MCGIAGAFYFSDPPLDARERLQRMTDRLRHRGPDAEGFHASAPIYLGHRRLSIIDLAGGKQPMPNETRDTWVTFNGEIFNFPELRADLQKRGHRFETQSDTETIVHAYEEYGERCPEYLRGQFAFAVWDGKKQGLFLARDRLGQKPLYTYEDRDKFLFASEIKAILAHGNLQVNLDYAVVGHYLTLGFIPHPRTQFKEIRKLEPGQSLFVRPGASTFRKYWQVPFPTGVGEDLPLREVLVELEDRLLDAVRIRLVSDVPLGAFLSGGLDSSLVVALMARLHTKPVQTFSIAFGESSYDESPYARQVAEHLKTDHHEIPVDCRIDDKIDTILGHFDEPFADSSAIPQFFVCEAARRHVTVSLSGDAGDEIFVGYRRYLGRKMIEIYRHLPRAMRDGIYGVSRMLIKDSEVLVGKSVPKMFRRFLESQRLYEADPANSWLPLFAKTETRELLGEEIFRMQDESNPLSKFFHAYQDRDPVSQMIYADQQSYFPDDILVKVDRMSMFHSLEVRSPLLDHPLVEWAAKLPLQMKLRGFTGKYVLRKLAEKYLPPEIIHRRKQGFAVPIARWFKGELKTLVADRLLSGKSEVFRREFVEKMLHEHASGRRDWSQQLWALLSLKATFRDLRS